MATNAAHSKLCDAADSRRRFALTRLYFTVFVSLLFLLVKAVTAQQIGTYTPEAYPSLLSEICTLAGGCKPSNTSIVLEANLGYMHNVRAYIKCVD